jgi:glycosyltransferase involved in cell wall biosynthesis
MSKAKVSVVMAVYNGQEYLNIAIDSVLLQTHKNLELIIIDDGSTDNSKNIIKNYDDKRVRYIYQDNQGLAAALNHGIKAATGSYIARMDCDDISYPTRLAEQIAYLEKKKSVMMVGTSFDLVDQDGRIIDRSIHLDRATDIKLEFLVRNPFGHGTVMIRKNALENTGVYDSEQPIEDYELWWRIVQNYPVANIPKQLYGWRVNPESMSHKGDNKRQKYINKLMSDIWSKNDKLTLNKNDIKSGFDHYEKLGPKYQEQYLYFLAALNLALRKKRRYIESIKLSQSLRGLPGGKIAYRDMKKHPRSHNYNVSNIEL